MGIRTFTRADLPELRAATRQQAFAALDSFDFPVDASESARVLLCATVLDPSRVPGLAPALAASDADAVVRVVMEAFIDAARAQSKPAEAPALTDLRRRLADDALDHRFTFYDETHQLPPDINWDFNPGTAHWGHDLNRFTFLTPLTAAALHLRDERYGRKAISLILDWIDKADWGKAFQGSPYVFGSYLNHALHMGEWTNCLTHLVPAGMVRGGELLTILKSLHDHLAYLRIVTAGHAGNWPTIGARGMMQTVGRVPMLRAREQTAQHCVILMDEQIAQQVLPDGVQDELTPHYHGVVVTNLFECLRLMGPLGARLTPRTYDTLGRMLRYLQHTVTPAGKTQLAFNDSDPDAVYDWAGQSRELGLSDLLLPVDQLGPTFYPWAGVAFLRQPPTRGDFYLAFDVGPFGRSHQHEDKLSFWLHAHGRDFIVDPGRHLYDNSAKSFRADLKHSRVHSTALIDGLGQASVNRRETWISKEPIEAQWRVAPGLVHAQGVYDLGYGPDNAVQATHTRRAFFIDERFWLLVDTINSASRRHVDLRFQFGPGQVAAARDESGCAVCDTLFDDANLRLHSVADRPYETVVVRSGQAAPREGWYSRRYGLLEPAPNLSLAYWAQPPTHAATLLLPYLGTAKPHTTLKLHSDAVEVQIDSESWRIDLNPSTLPAIS